MLTVVTHTQFNRPEFLERCKESVAKALPANAEHKIILLDGNFEHGRYDAFKLDEFVALVDDDDTIHPDSISMCLDALTSTDSDMAFTNEVVVDEKGNKISAGDRSIRTFYGLSSGPRHAHHLVMIRTSAISPKALELGIKYGAGIEWFITVSAAFSRNKAIHVPLDGYNWTIHGKNRCLTPIDDYRNAFRFRSSEMRKDINTIWKVPNMLIPIHKIT